MNTEEALIRAFVEPIWRDRLVGLLSSPSGREKLRTELARFDHLDRRFCQEIPASHRSIAGIEQMLRTLGAPDTCHLLSEDEDLDGLDLQLCDALDWVVGSGMATFISCIPGRLAFFEAEESRQRYVLERKRV